MKENNHYNAIVIGTSHGGMNALKFLLPKLPATFSMPIIVVQHIGALSESNWIEAFDNYCQLHVKEADEKEKIEKGIVYIAPPNYHLLVERNETFSLSIDQRVNYARPSIDVLFESAALVFQNYLIGILLTGANNDGASGIKKISESGGLTIVQDPETAESPYMPTAAIEVTTPDYVLDLKKIKKLIIKLHLTNTQLRYET